MTTRSIGKAKLQTKDGRTKIEPTRGYRDVSKRIGAKKQADREVAAWQRAAKGRATVERKA